MDYIVFKYEYEKFSWHTFGPVRADDPAEAIAVVARGTGVYVPQGRGRYSALPLRVWQDGVFDYTKGRGLEKVALPATSTLLRTA